MVQMETYVFHRESDKTFITRKTKLKIIFQVQDFFLLLLYLESVFLSVAYLTVANLARLGISVHC